MSQKSCFFPFDIISRLLSFGRAPTTPVRSQQYVATSRDSFMLGRLAVTFATCVHQGGEVLIGIPPVALSGTNIRRNTLSSSNRSTNPQVRQNATRLGPTAGAGSQG